MNADREREILARGERVLLTRFVEADIDAHYVGWLNDPLVTRFSNQRFRRHDHDTCLAYVRSFAATDNLFVRIGDASDGRPLGTMTAYLASMHGTADIGIMVGERAAWGRGVGLEAWTLLMRHLFEVRGLRKLTGGTLRCNHGMVAIMERAGMTLEGIRVGQEIVEGEPQDILYYGRFAPGRAPAGG